MVSDWDSFGHLKGPRAICPLSDHELLLQRKNKEERSFRKPINLFFGKSINEH
jgi:hypothetical protein